MNTLLFLLSSYALMNSFDMINDVAASLSIFLFVLLYKYSCQRFLSHKHENFHLVMTRTSDTSQLLPNVPDNFPKTSELCWRCLKMFWLPLSSSASIWKTTIFERCAEKSILSTFWNIFREIELNCPYKWYAKKNALQLVSLAWEIVLDAWDRCLQSAGVRLTHNG